MSTPKLVKTTEKTNNDIKPRRIFQNPQENIKSDRDPNENKITIQKNPKGISSSVGSKAFLQNFVGVSKYLAHNGHKQSFDSKENNFNQANLKSRIGAKEN